MDVPSPILLCIVICMPQQFGSIREYCILIYRHKAVSCRGQQLFNKRMSSFKSCISAHFLKNQNLQLLKKQRLTATTKSMRW